MKPVYLIITVLGFLSCKKDCGIKRKANAEIFKFNSEKCLCCWGWYVKKDNDTLKIDVLPPGVNISDQINTPIPVYIELGAKKYNCSPYDYYEVKKLEIPK